MKLGLYGGGFKPFHTGHFAKLLLALDEADKVVSFFGIKKQKFSKKTGKPLKTKFRSFGSKQDARVFNQEMQEEVVSIYEDALENAFPGNLDIVPSADETPIRKIFNVLSSFAYQNMTSAEREELSEDVPQISIGQNLTDFNMNSVDEIVVVAGQEELDRTYLSGIDRQAEKSGIGRKIKELIDSGKIRFETGAGDQQRLVDLLKKYRPAAGEDHVLVRGTDVRNLAGDGNIDSLLNYIPNVVPEEQKAQLIKILIGDKSQNESFFMPIVTDSTVLRAAARFASNKTEKRKITEQARKGEGHILGLTEDMSLTFDALKSLISDVLLGRVTHIEEKMDGQNLTFTVLDSGEIRIFGKGVTANALSKGGKGKADLEAAYGKNKNLLDAFSSAYNVVEKYLASKDSDLIQALFQNGRVVIEGQIMTPINPNTIPYTENHVRFVRPFTPDDLEIDMNAYRDVFEDADMEIQDQDGRSWSFGPVPKLEQVQADAGEMQSKIEELERDIENLVSGINPAPKTVGDYASHAMEMYIEKVAPKIKLGNLSSDQKKRALDRLATGNKTAIGKKELATFWPEIQKFEKLRTAHVAAAIADLEKIVQKLGTYFFDTLEFALATNDAVVTELAAEVEKIKLARDSDVITIKNIESGDVSSLVDTAWATKLDSSLSRVEQMDLFKKAVEGVVLRLPGPEGKQIVRKLTGMFTPIHRLVSLFRYPDRYSKQVLTIEEPESELTDSEKDAMNELLKTLSHRLSESKGGFKNTSGKSLTVDIDLENVEPTLEDFFGNHLANFGVELYKPIGSTGKKSKSGDLDIVIQSPSEKADKKIFKDSLVKSLNQSLLDGQAKLLGQNIAVMYPIQGGQPGEYVQIDIMMDDSPEDTAWLMSGTGDGGIKGVYRNLMLSYIANRRSRSGDPSEKMTLSFPGGLQIKIMPGGLDPKDPKNKRKWQDVGKRIRDPDEIIRRLDIFAAAEDIETFQELVDIMKSDDTLSEYLNGFEDYIQRYLSDEKTSEQARKAVDYIDSTISESRDLNSLYDMIELLLESETDQASIPFAKVLWSDSLKMFPGVWENKTSASASGGMDEEGAEKAVAINENLIYLKKLGYSVSDVGNGIIISGKGDKIKLDKSEGIEYMLGLGSSQSLPVVKIKHVPGLEKYDLLMIEGSKPMEVKKMAAKTVFSKLGSSTGRNFEMGVKFLKPMRRAASIANTLLKGRNLVDQETGRAKVRDLEGVTDISDLAIAVEAIDYLFFRSRYGTSPKELKGLSVKIDSGQLPSGLIRKILGGETLDTPSGNCLDLCTKALNNTLGEYSPANKKDNKKDFDTDVVDIHAKVGDEAYDGKISLDYFYNDLIFKLYDSELDEIEIPEEKMKYYTDSLDLVASIYDPISKLSEIEGDGIFDDFLRSLVYSGLYGVLSDSYYVTPCDSQRLTVYSTTQGFRALLKFKEVPSLVIEDEKTSAIEDVEDDNAIEVDLDPDKDISPDEDTTEDNSEPEAGEDESQN